MTAFEADLDRLHAWLEAAAERGAVPVVCGANGDMDTVASAVALASALPQAMACGRHLGRLANVVNLSPRSTWVHVLLPASWQASVMSSPFTLTKFFAFAWFDDKKILTRKF